VLWSQILYACDSKKAHCGGDLVFQDWHAVRTPTADGTGSLTIVHPPHPCDSVARLCVKKRPAESDPFGTEIYRYTE
jgi:hypothetical protein